METLELHKKNEKKAKGEQSGQEEGSEERKDSHLGMGNRGAGLPV